MVVILPEAEMLRRYGMSKPMLSGDCAIGWHEGTKPRDYKGTPVPGCGRWETCTCECHVSINEMYEVAGLPREVHLNPEYVPFKRTWYMPIFGVDFGLDRSALDATRLDDTGRQQRTVSEPPGARSFEPTPSGRAARGQLEDQVLEVCIEWSIDPGELCTPAFIAWDIARVHGIKEPSTGAIGAVFDRWAKYGFAVIERKPVRFTGFTEAADGGKALDFLKAQYKRNKKMGK